jgi:hypothetical protein
VKVLSFLSCEDTRQEIDGKTTLVGIYDGLNVAPTQPWPITIRFAAHLRFQLEDGDPIPDRIAMTISVDDETAIAGYATITLRSRDRPASFAIPMVFLPIRKPGPVSLTCEFQRDGKAILQACKLEVPVGAEPP